MSKAHRTTRTWNRLLCGCGLLLALGATGCQIDVAGMTLPSGYYLQDDVQYFPAGPEFVLSREAAAMKEYRVQQELEQ